MDLTDYFGEPKYKNRKLNFEFSTLGVEEKDVAGLFQQFIDNHNTQVDAEHQFKVGLVTVTDPNDYLPRSDTQYLNTWESINKKLIEPLGGYLFVRHEEDGVYIDYLKEIDELITQEIEFGKI